MCLKSLNEIHTGSEDVLVLEKDTLGGSSRSRSVHDTAQVLRLRRNRLDHVLLTLLGELVEAENGQVGVGALELLDVILLDFHLAVVNDILDVLGLFQRVDELCEKMRVEENELGVCLLEGMHKTLLAECVVCGDDGHGLGGSAWKGTMLDKYEWSETDAQIVTMSGCKPPRTGRGKDVDAVALVHAKSAVARGNLEAELLVLDEADVCVAAELRELPLLVLGSLLAIDNLLDLLDFLVSLDQSAVTQGLCVAKLLGAAAKNVVDGLDVGSRGADESILC